MIPNLESWWISLPLSNFSLKRNLQEAINEFSEVCLGPESFICPLKRFFNFMLRMLTLEEVNYKMFPDVYFSETTETLDSTTTISFIKTCRVFPIRKLTFYCELNANIVTDILERCPHLESLFVSCRDLLDQVIISIGKYCPRLRILKLMGNFASKDALTKGFFMNASAIKVKDAFATRELVPVSFPKLKLLNIGCNECEFRYDVKTWILFYYESLCCCNFDAGSHFQTELFPHPLSEMNMKNLQLLRMNYTFWYQFRNCNLNSLTQLRNLKIRIDQDCTENNHLRAKENLMQIASGNSQLVYSLEYHISKDSHFRLMVIIPMLNSIGANVVSIYIYIAGHAKIRIVEVLENFVSNCPSLEIFKLVFQTMNNIAVELISNKHFRVQHSKLKELWLHEYDSWYFYDLFNIDNHPEWLKHLEILPNAFPELRILSLTIWDKENLPETFENLSSKVTTFHLSYPPLWDATETMEDIMKLVQRFPYLKNLYLEGIELKILWKLKNIFKNTNLNIYLGRIGGLSAF